LSDEELYILDNLASLAAIYAGKMKFRNLLNVPDEEFYLRHAESCGQEAWKYASLEKTENNLFMANFYFERAAQYRADYETILDSDNLRQTETFEG